MFQIISIILICLFQFLSHTATLLKGLAEERICYYDTIRVSLAFDWALFEQVSK